MRWKVLLSDIDISSAEQERVRKILKSRWLSLGEVTVRFEKEFAKFLGVGHAVAVSNGTAALHLALLAAGIGPGDEVLVPSMTFVATVNSILYCGAKPVFVEIDGTHNLNISIDDLKRRITEQTKAIMIVHYGGYPVDMPRVKEMAAQAESRLRTKIQIIEDAAHAPGAQVAGKKCGTWGDIGCFSFFANKNLVTGEGGMLVTDSDRLAEKLRLMRSHGMTTLSWERHQGHASTYDVVDLGYNYRLTEMQAALGIEQLNKLKKSNLRRKQLTEAYRHYLADVQELTIPFAGNAGQPSYHILPLILAEGQDRESLIDRLKRKGIQTSIHYPPVHHFSFYRQRLPEVSLPLTESVAKRQLTLPLHSKMKNSDIILVCREIKNALRNSR
jgi:dTDP-4-amino-4,6-dideoxygalactose transaminase